MSCNNLINSGSGFHSIGTTFPTTARAVRATKMLQEKIKNGEKVDTDFFKEMQMDVEDEFAKKMFPLLLSIVDDFKEDFFTKGSEEMEKINNLTYVLKKWDGKTTANSEEAVIYNVWVDCIFSGVLKKYFNGSEYERNSAVNNFFSNQFWGNMAKDWSNSKNLDSNFCKDGTARNDSCAYNVVNSLLKTHGIIVSTLGKNEVECWLYLITTIG